MSKAQHIDKTSAEDKSIGFDFQYYYFLYKLLNLKAGQTLGLEVMDDVHTEMDSTCQLLVQLKYTVQKQKDAKPRNLTTLDPDFWKTLSNWSKVIVDAEAGRSTVNAQLDFVSRTEFMLATNKSDNTANAALKSIRDFQSNILSFTDLAAQIKQIRSSTQNKDIAAYISSIQALPRGVSEQFFMNLRFDLGCDDIIQKCKDSILERWIDPSKVDEVFYSLDSQVRSDNFGLVSERKKILIDYEKFLKKYRIHFDKSRNGKLSIKRQFELPKEELGSQKFIKQLIEIGDVDKDEIEQISILFYHQLLAKNNVAEWLRGGEITSIDVKNLEDDAITNWNNKHRKAYRKIKPESEMNETAQDLVNSLREDRLTVSEQQMDRPFSNGEYYDLCERSKLGWRKDWKDRY